MADAKYGYPAARYKPGEKPRLVLTEAEDEKALADGWADHPNGPFTKPAPKPELKPEPKAEPKLRPVKGPNADSAPTLDSSTTK